jgi:hypothetical protein
VKIMVFTEGTILIQRAWTGMAREDVVRLVRERRPAVDYADAVPVGGAVQKLQAWARQGAEICYLTSRTTPAEINDVHEVLVRSGFPGGELYHRGPGEAYHDVATRAAPDVIVEDNCESIGGEAEMTYPSLRPDVKTRVQSVVVAEFGGIDHLPDEIDKLRAY